MPILYESYAPYKETRETTRKYSPSSSPSLWPYALCFFAGVFIGWPLGREMLKAAAGIAEEEIRKRIEARTR